MSFPSSYATRRRLWSALGATTVVLAIAAPAANAAAGSSSPPSLAAPPTASLTGLAGNLVGLGTGGANPVDALSSEAGGLAKVGLDDLGSWVLNGARAALQETASVIDRTTAPRLESTWFSATYWRVAGLAALITLPFLFAAAVQALLRSDLALLVRAAFGYLPLALIGVSLAAPITMLLLSVSDEMSSVIAGAGAGGGVHFLQQTAAEMAGLGGLNGSPFLGFAIGLLTIGAALALAVEMLVREAAVYIVVLMLPLAFAGLVWPARRTWAVRLVEMLIALILSKFVIVAVLSLAGAAYGSTGSPSTTRLLTAMALVMLSSFAPWVMLRLLPFTELAAGAGGAIRAELPSWTAMPTEALAAADGLASWAERLPHRLRPQADEPGRPLAGGREATRARPQDGDRAQPPNGASDRPGEADTTEPPAATQPLEPPSGGPRNVAAGGDPAGPRAPIGNDPPAGRPAERLPGLPSRWQADDMEAAPLFLGRAGAASVGGPQPPSAGQSSVPALADDESPVPGEELPLPPAQEKDGGSL